MRLGPIYLHNRGVALATLNTVVARDGDDMARLVSRMLTDSPYAGTQTFYAALDEELPGRVRRDIERYFCTGDSAAARGAPPRIRAGQVHTALMQANFALVPFLSRLLTRVRTENTAAARQRFYRDLYRELQPVTRNDIRNQFCSGGAGVKSSRRRRTRTKRRRQKKTRRGRRSRLRGGTKSTVMSEIAKLNQEPPVPDSDDEEIEDPGTDLQGWGALREDRRTTREHSTGLPSSLHLAPTAAKLAAEKEERVNAFVEKQRRLADKKAGKGKSTVGAHVAASGSGGEPLIMRNEATGQTVIGQLTRPLPGPHAILVPKPDNTLRVGDVIYGHWAEMGADGR